MPPNFQKTFVNSHSTIKFEISHYTVHFKMNCTQQNIHGSVTGCGRQHPVTDPYTLRYRPGKIHVAYRLYIRICAALIQYRYSTDLLYGSVTDVLSYVLYTNCIYMFIQWCRIQVWYRHFIHICDRCVIKSIVYKLYSRVCTVMQNTGMVRYSWYVSVTDICRTCHVQICKARGVFPASYTDWLQ